MVTEVLKSLKKSHVSKWWNNIMEKLAKRYINIILKPKFSSSQQIVFRLMGQRGNWSYSGGCSAPSPFPLQSVAQETLGRCVQAALWGPKVSTESPIEGTFFFVRHSFALSQPRVFSFLLNHSSPSCLPPLIPLLPSLYSAHLFGQLH